MQAHYTERQARDVIASLADALSYMHAKKIAHRDLKVLLLAALSAVWMFWSPRSLHLHVHHHNVLCRVVACSWRGAAREHPAEH
jgi:serine/threonine protein kinase